MTGARIAERYASQKENSARTAGMNGKTDSKKPFASAKGFAFMRRAFFRQSGGVNAAPSGQKRFLREIMEEVLEAAARAGFPDPDRLWRMTPAAMERAVSAYGAQAARDDRRAWMAGYYCAIAYHSPGRFPRKPHLVHQTPKIMTEEEMRRTMMAFAAERSRL